MSQPSEHPVVAVVILNWNGISYLERFLPILNRSTYPNLKLYVADNGSTDNSVNWLQTHHPHIQVLSSKTNLGFAGGYNWAISQLNEELLVLLNSDIEVDPGWIEPVVQLFNQHQYVAAIQPKIMDFHRRDHFEYAGAAGGWMDRLGYPFSRGRVFDVLEKDHGQYDTIQEIFWASGAAMFIRKSAFNQAGGFDEFFFAHQEEIDLCWRMQRLGWRLLVCPQSIVYHIGGGTLPKDNPRKVFLNFRNNLIMLYKNLSLAEASWILPGRFALDAISAYKNLFSMQSSYFFAVMRAHFAFLGWMLFHQKRSVRLPANNREVALKGLYQGSIVWQHFIRGKNRFSEIVSSLNG